MIKKATFLAFMILVLLACQLPVSLKATSEPIAAVNWVVTANPRATVTRTPFQPIPPTVTPTVTATPTITPTPIPPTPTKKPKIRPPDEQMSILILGSDERPGGGYRTDVIALLIINPNGTASVISFPRDLWVMIPGWGYERINTAMQHGFETMAATMQANFGIRPQAYMMTNFSGFIGIIDALDGIDVKVAEPLEDKCDLPIADGKGVCHIEKATVPMDGETALWYVRSRYSTSDFDRQRRAQEVLQAILRRLLSLDAVSRAPQLYTEMIGSVETDLGLETIVRLLTLAPSLAEKGNVRRYALDPTEAIPYVMAGGAQVLLPNYPAIQAKIQEALSQ